MEEKGRISKIKELDLNKNFIEKFVIFDASLGVAEMAVMFNEFGFDKDKIESGIKINRDLALIFKLIKEDPYAKDDWQPFINEVLPQKDSFSKLDNIFVGKDFKKILLVTNQRLLRYDLDRLNKKVNETNLKINIYNAPFIRKPSFKERIGVLFRY